MFEKRGSGPSPAAVFDALPGKFLFLDPNLTIIGVTDAYLAATMTVRSAIVGRALFDVFPDNPDDPAADGVRNLKASLTRVLAERRPDRMAVQKYDIRRPDADGGGFEERYWSPINLPVLTPDGGVQCIIHAVEDVTDLVRLRQETVREHAALNAELRAGEELLVAETFLRREAVEASRRLGERERHYHFLADSIPLLVWTAGRDGGVTYVNERWVDFTGRRAEELHGAGWKTCLHPEDREQVLLAWDDAMLAGAGSFQQEYRLRRHDGEWRTVLTTARSYPGSGNASEHWFIATADIHDRLIAEDQLRRAQRLHAVGKLAGGLAHEVNNMMSAVLGFGDLVLSQLPPGSPLRSDVEQMVAAGSRAADVTRQMLAFSRQQVLQVAVLDANVVVHNLTPVLERLLGASRRLEVVPCRQDVRLRADRVQLEQVLINLVSNSRDATGDDGVVVLHTDRVVLGAADLVGRHDPEVEPGPFVRLRVRDNGTGMDPEVLARVFEPFFTTKAVGHGTGLGLSMVYGMVKQSGGFVSIDSSPGAGTTIAIHFPAVHVEATPALRPSAARPGRGERVLVVEDEAVIRSLTIRILAANGYQVCQAPNGLAALDYLASHAGQVDLVLTDVEMPRMSGYALAESVGRQYPGMPLIFMSGYPGEEMVRRGLVQPDIPYLQKPLTVQELLDAVRHRLDAAPVRATRARVASPNEP